MIIIRQQVHGQYNRQQCTFTCNATTYYSTAFMLCWVAKMSTKNHKAQSYSKHFLFLLGMPDEPSEEIVSVEAVISPEFISSKSRKVSAPVRSPPPPPVTSSARLGAKAESIGSINKTDGGTPTHSGGAKGKQKMRVQPSKSLSSLDEASPAKHSTGKKKLWPLKIFRSQKNL